MTQQYEDVMGIEFVLPAAPPLTDPPLSLLDEATRLVDLQGLVAKRQVAVERAASAQEQLAAYDRLAELSSAGDQPSETDSAEDARKALEQQQSEWDTAYADVLAGRDAANATVESLDTQLKDLQRFEGGFLYLPELSNGGAVEIFTPDTSPAISNPTAGPLKTDDDNQNLFAWYDPFVAVSRDRRSTFGWPHTDYAERAARALRSLEAHESWQAEHEFWSGASVPTNYHLSASPDSPLVSPHRTLVYGFPNPTAAPGTVLGTAVGLAQSLEALDQAIADSDGGVGMIHATPYVMQAWMRVFSYLRDSKGQVRTVNNNVLVPGYGYPGTGPDQTSRTVADGEIDTDNTLESATAAFTTFDLGMPVVGDGIPEGTCIASIVSASAVTLTKATTQTAGGVTVTLPGVALSFPDVPEGRGTGNVQQWAYATDYCYHLRGDAMTYPVDLREMSPALPVDNDVPVRSERSHAIITNRLLRAAVLVDTSMS